MPFNMAIKYVNHKNETISLGDGGLCIISPMRFETGNGRQMRLTEKYPHLLEAPLIKTYL
jgi:hypothetical protein